MAVLARAVVAGVLTAGIAAGYMWLWWWGSDRPECRQGSDFGTCMDTALGVLVIGGPLTLLCMWLALRLGGASHPAVGTLVVTAVVIILARVTGPVDLPLWIWSPLTGAVAVAYTIVSRGRLDSSTTDGS